MKDLQAKHKEWCEKNFGGREPKVNPMILAETARLATHMGKIAHHALKAYQGIRGTTEEHLMARARSKRFLAVDCIEPPLISIGIGDLRDFQAICGVIEEVGELCCAETIADRVDAVADIALYLMDFCNFWGIDFEDAVRQTAAKVHARNWNKNSVNGEVE